MTTVQTTQMTRTSQRSRAFGATLASVPALAQGRAWRLDSCVRAEREMTSYFRCLPSILPQGSHAKSGAIGVAFGGVSSPAGLANAEGRASFS
jgi:hypothetical protein